jgi:hypothetical protein
MGIERRDFLKLAAAAGFVLAGPSVAPRVARAEGPYRGPFWVTIHAGGGWDPTMLCDPKGRAGEDDPEPINRYDRGEIETVGPFSFAPVEGHRAFFERFRDDLLVINGLDAGTNSHDTGTRHIWSGGFDANMPSIAALVAATRGDTPALGYLSFGGYEQTDQLVAPTRIPSVTAINEIAYPHRIDTRYEDSLLLRPEAYDRIAAARAARLERLAEHATLPREQRAMSVLFETGEADNELTRLTAALPETVDASNNPLRRQAEVACAAFASGLSVSAGLSVGGFDTHGDHDNRHTAAMRQVIEGLTHLWDEAERQGIADQLVVAIGSDFARTPWYNATNGKDHWSVTSMMLMGAGIRGGRVIGATDENQLPVLVNPSTLQADPGGIRLTPGHVHSALRRLAGIESHPLTAPYMLDGEALDLLT